NRGQLMRSLSSDMTQHQAAAAPFAGVRYESSQHRYGAQPNVVGLVVRFANGPYTIVGVLPPGLTLGRTVASPGQPVDRAFWTPVGQDSSNYYIRSNHSYSAIGRLKTVASMDRPAAEMERLLRPTADEPR